jgi:MFS family permease
LIYSEDEDMGGRSWARSLPFYYGWVIFAVTFLIYAFMYGLRYSVGVFFTPVQAEFGWTTAMTASAVTVFFWVYAFSAPLVGNLAERIGVRRTVLIGGLLLGGGGALVSFVQELWHLYLFWGVIAAVGAAALYVIPTTILSRFFRRKRGRAVERRRQRRAGHHHPRGRRPHQRVGLEACDEGLGSCRGGSDLRNRLRIPA